MNEKAKTPCPDPMCGAFHGHHPLCNLQTVEEKAARLATVYNEWTETRKQLHHTHVRMQQMVLLWQGKCSILRHENNKLRAAMYRQERKKKR